MDGGYEIEMAIRRAIDKKVDFRYFADSARFIAGELELSPEDRDRIFGRLAKEIHTWLDEKSKD